MSRHYLETRQYFHCLDLGLDLEDCCLGLGFGLGLNDHCLALGLGVAITVWVLYLHTKTVQGTRLLSNFEHFTE